MNILVFSWRDPKHPTSGGAEQVMHEHMKGWLRAGNKVTLFSSKVARLPEKEILDGVQIIRKGDQYLGVKIAAFFFWMKNGKNFDIVVDQFHGIPFFTPLYIKKPKFAVLQEVAGKVWFLNELAFPFNVLAGLLGYLFEPVIFLFYKKIPFIVGSNSAKIDLLRMKIPAKNITVVPHGVITDIPRPFPGKEKIKTVIFLGALAKDKGVEDVLKTFSSLDKMGNYRFWLVGRGSPEYKNFLTSICKKLRIINKVVFWGFVSQKKKFELLARAQVLINPSVREGWGLVNIEANSVGTPVVSYNSAGLIDSVKDGVSGVIVGRNTPEELANAVSDLLSDEKKYIKMQEGAISWSKNFNWRKSRIMSLRFFDRYMKIY